jgi:GAF domain-containing protein
MDPRNDAAPPSPDPRNAFAELSKIMLGAEPLDAVLARIAELAKQTIPEVAEASVTLVQDGQVSSVVFTGSLAVDLDERQYEAGFGPCVDAAASGATIAIPDTVASSDYPDFARAARRRGINATLSVGLPVEQRTIGALNLYGSSGEPFDDSSAELARAFASYAAVAVANAGVYASTQELARNLQRALTSRAIIDQAKGILMAQHRLTADDAFELLSRQSQRDNRKLRELAAEIVASVQPVDLSLDVGDKL